MILLSSDSSDDDVEFVSDSMIPISGPRVPLLFEKEPDTEESSSDESAEEEEWQAPARMFKNRN